MPLGPAEGYNFLPHSNSSVGQGEAELKPGIGSSDLSLDGSGYVVAQKMVIPLGLMGYENPDLSLFNCTNSTLSRLYLFPPLWSHDSLNHTDLPLDNFLLHRRNCTGQMMCTVIYSETRRDNLIRGGDRRRRTTVANGRCDKDDTI